MSRSTLFTKTKIAILGVAIVLIGAAGVWDVAAHHAASNVKADSVAQAPTTQVTYRGQNGKDALTLLKQYAQGQHMKVVTKSSSLGDYVVSINGNDGGGKKYWLFYVNGKQADVGAAAYVTKTGDVIQWKLEN